jgi:hypothetical protein
MAARLLDRPSTLRMSHGRASARQVIAPSGLEIPAADPLLRGAERRTEHRFTPSELRDRLEARYKYGESVTLVDLSVGGVQFETPRLVRPDVDVVLEIIDSRTREISQVISRVLRANVSGLSGGVKYRAACAFKHRLAHSTLVLPTPSLTRPVSPDYLKLELELKTILEDHVARQHRRDADPSSLLDALSHVRSAAERRRDPTDRQFGVLLAVMIPALQRKEPSDAVLGQLHDQLAKLLPLLAIRASGSSREAPTQDCESITLNMGVDGNPTLAVTAEFPSGFGLDASQFRLLKLSAYLVGVLESWNSLAFADQANEWVPREEMPREPEPSAAPAEAIREAADDLPFGWHRVVLRSMDGQLLHGYSNDFYPDRTCFQFSPRIGCPAGERMLVPIGRLKAVFFVRDLRGDRQRVDAQAFDHKPRGRKVQVTFRDGEVMTGSTLTYKPNAQGFFLVPATTQDNNVRVYVVTAAVRHIRFV